MSIVRFQDQPFGARTESGALGFLASDAGFAVGPTIHPLGQPIADGLRNSKIEYVSGVLRQDVSNPSHWFFINDSGHVPVGFDTVYSDITAGMPQGNLRASGGALYVRFAKAYARVIAVQVTPDETLANDYGLICGPSVGLDQITIRAKVNRQIAGTIRWDGAAWAVSMGEFQGLPPTVTYNPTTGGLLVDHSNEFCRGLALKLERWFISSPEAPYAPGILGSVTNSSFTIYWTDATGARVTGAPSTRMAVFFSKHMSTAARLDGASGWDAVPFHTGGNLWLKGIMELAA